MGSKLHRKEDQPTANQRPAFGLISLLAVLTICAFFTAWLVDYQVLAKRKRQAKNEFTVVYKLSHGSANLVSQRLADLFESETIGHDPNTNAVVVIAPRNDHERIRLLLRQIDRTSTQKPKSNASTTPAAQLTTH